METTMAIGHTDKATINSRKALSPQMRTQLYHLQSGPIASSRQSQSEKNSMRALEARGYVWWSMATKTWNITGAGLSLIEGLEPSIQA